MDSERFETKNQKCLSENSERLETKIVYRKMFMVIFGGQSGLVFYISFRSITS